MLGIGFIIAHFVAMQKPQQRKYHSSCNRSVHRGTAHGKQEVKVCKRKTPHLLMRSFLSPYGDGTVRSYERSIERCVFAPLRGWYCGQRKSIPDARCFRPLTGMVPILPETLTAKARFRPLTGMVLKSARSFLKQSSFRSLTGIVQTKGENVMKCTCFRPLAGIVP